jgi:hypothetical protein
MPEGTPIVVPLENVNDPNVKLRLGKPKAHVESLSRQ